MTSNGIHIFGAIAKDTARMVSSLYHSRKYLNPAPMLYLYKNQVKPRMKYCCNVWAGIAQSSLSSLNRVQNCLYRLVGDELFSTLQILILQTKYCQAFTPLLILLWQMFGHVKFFSSISLNLHRQDLPWCHVPSGKPTLLLSCPELFLCGINSWENASLISKTLVQLISFLLVLIILYHSPLTFP